MNLLQEDIKNISEIFFSWDRDLGNLEGDTQFLLQQAGRIDKILKQMRSLSVVSGSRSKMSVDQILHDAVNIVGDLFSKAGVEIVERYQAQNHDVKLDRDELLQVLTNLFRNSLQAIVEKKVARGEGTLIVTTQNEGGQLIIDVTDNGVGIAIANQAKLFESQFSTKAPDLGTGLGLSISRRFVRAFDGDLSLLKSHPGAGATFRIALPLHAEPKQGAVA